MVVCPINKVTFYQDGNHAPVAVLNAAEQATPEELLSIRNAVEKVGWRQVPVYADGQNALQISGFKDESHLEQWLRTQYFINDNTTISHQTPSKQNTAIGHIQKSSLKLTGLLNILGDGILALSGHHNKDPFRIAGGALLSLGSINLLRYGNANSDHYMREVSDDLKTFISNQEGTPPPAIGTLRKIENFLYQNPAQVTLGINSVGATSNLISGIRKTRSDEGWGALGFGIGSVGLKLLTLLIPEKPKNENSHHGTGGIVGWIQEKPLRFYGYTSFATDLFLGLDAFQEYKKNPKNWGLYTSTALAGTCYALADLTVAMSHKDHTNQEDGQFTACEQRGIEAIAANSLLRHSLSEQQQRADSLGEFLAKRKEMQGDARSISRAILEQATQLRSSSWVERSSKPMMPPITSL